MGAAAPTLDPPGESLPKDSPRFNAAIIASRFNCMPLTESNGRITDATRQLKRSDCKVELAVISAVQAGEAILFARKLKGGDRLHILPNYGAVK